MPGPRLGAVDLPAEQRTALRRAIRLEWVTLTYTASAVVVVYLALGNSQAMKASWVEDLTSLVPPAAFLVAVRISNRPPSRNWPYGRRRVIGVAHLVAGTALVLVGVSLIYDSASSLLSARHPTIGTVELLGHDVWQGWMMIAALSYTGVPPVVLGRLKLRLARTLEDKVLLADAEMNKADWLTAGAAIVGVLGIGAGVWWADSVAALLISGSILNDGRRNMLGAIRDLMDRRATAFDESGPDPLIRRIEASVAELAWAEAAESRVRDLGGFLHVEVFVVPTKDVATVAQVDTARALVMALHWTIQDVVVMPVAQLAGEGKSQHPQ